MSHVAFDGSDGPFDTSTVALDILKWKNGLATALTCCLSLRPSDFQCLWFTVSASFFLLGSQIAGREAIVRRMVAEGHNIGSHSFSHPHFNLLTVNIEQEITTTQAAIFAATNKTVTDFRPPYSECNKPCQAVLAAQPYKVRLWNLDTVWQLLALRCATTLLSAHNWL
jgi:hypothetical protein